MRRRADRGSIVHDQGSQLKPQRDALLDYIAKEGSIVHDQGSQLKHGGIGTNPAFLREGSIVHDQGSQLKQPSQPTGTVTVAGSIVHDQGSQLKLRRVRARRFPFKAQSYMTRGLN